MELVVQTVVNGLSLGASYALIAIGLTIVFGIGRIVNFAHGEFLMVGAFGAFTAMSLGLSYPVSIVVGVLAAALVGWAIERLIISRGLYAAPEGSSIIVTFAISLALMSGAQMIFGSRARSIDSPLNEVRLSFADIALDGQRTLAGVIAAMAVIILSLWLRKSRMGMQLRAVSQNARGALYSGINVEKVRTTAFVLGTALAALAGVLIAPSQAVYPTLGQSAVVTAFTVVILGGLGSVAGAAAGGFAIGLLYAFVGTYISVELTSIVGWVLVIVMLLFRPQGLLGKKPTRA